MDDNEVILKYKELKTVKKVAKHFKCRTTKISSILNKNNIKRFYGTVRHFSVNESFFDNLNSIVAYWIGFLAADGYIEKKYVYLGLAKKDQKHIKKFKKDLNSEHKIYFKLSENNKRNHKWKDSWVVYIRICSKYMIESLKKYNVINNKSLNLEFSDIILNSKYIHDYMRGYFDGDGCITYNKKNKSLQLKVRGSENFLKQFHLILSKNLELSVEKKVSFDSGTFQLQYHGNNICSKILNWLYKDSQTYLDRKYKKAAKYFV